MIKRKVKIDKDNKMLKFSAKLLAISTKEIKLIVLRIANSIVLNRCKNQYLIYEIKANSHVLINMLEIFKKERMEADSKVCSSYSSLY